jgi:hypothetical protein
MTLLDMDLAADSEDLLPALERRLSKDARAAAKMLSREEGRYLVSLYYDLQKVRIGSGNQIGAAHRQELPPPTLLQGIHGGMTDIEARIQLILKAWVNAQPIGQWLMQVMGIGPILAAGLISHVDIHKARTAGAIWRFAGLDPSIVWGKGEKRPYNADLKVLCWKIGESFVKVHNRPQSVYGRLYTERKALETERNESGQNAEKAAAVLASPRAPGRGTEARASLEAGKLPQAQIHLRACRYAVKIFLSHMHQAWWMLEFKEPVPVPYAIAHQGHTHFLEPEVPFPPVAA